jgi:glycosyltransferase involved in cell wall biosynthesis
MANVEDPPAMFVRPVSESLTGSTIALSAEMPQAIVLASSFLQFHPHGAFAILLLDGPGNAERLPRGARVLHLSELDLPEGEHWRLPMLYNAAELKSLLTPALLQILLKSGSAIATYFEDSTEIFSSLSDILETVKTGDTIIASEAIRSEGGNLGRSFVAAGRGAEESLRSWFNRMRREKRGQEAPSPDVSGFTLEGSFDSIPHRVITNPGVAVGYWNLNPETFSWTGDRYELSGKPLRSFDFRGYDPGKPHLLSKHQGSEPRILLNEWGAIARLCDEYRDKLIEAGYRNRRASYPFDYLRSGLRIDHRMLHLYRAAEKRYREGLEKEPPSPFGPEGEEGFLNWLNEPVRKAPPIVTRYMLAVYEEREDVKQVFPDPTGANAAGFHDWYLLFGQRELDLPVAVLPFAARAKGEEQGDRLPNGLRIDHRMLHLYRKAEKMHKQGLEKKPPSPFNPEKKEDFLNWLNEPVRKAPPVITRYMLAVYEERDDVRKAFPDPTGADAASFRDWYVLFGQHKLSLPAAVRLPDVEPKAEASKASGAISATPVNVAGYFRAELGLGSVARSLVAALAAADIPFNTISFDGTANRQDHPFADHQSDSGPADINIVCINADNIAAFAEKTGPELWQGRYTIGLWFWEVEDFPGWLHGAFNYVDEVWVASHFMREAFLKVSPKPVSKFKLPVFKPDVDLSLSRENFGLPNGFVFLFSFDFFSVLERKNPLALIEAFTRAFRPAEGPVLVIKTINGDKHILEMEKLRYAIRGREDIILMDGYLSTVQNSTLTALSDCYVSLHRSEGFGLTIAEAMVLGRPTIATAYSGNLEFMTEENSYLCPAQRSEVGPERAPYPAFSHWAEPDLEVAAQLLRHVYTNQEEARAKGFRAADDIRKLHNASMCGSVVRNHLDQIRQRRSATRSRRQRVENITRQL